MGKKSIIEILFKDWDILDEKRKNTTNPEEISKIDQAIGNIKFALGRVYGSKTRKSKAPVIQPKSSRKR